RRMRRSTGSWSPRARRARARRSSSNCRATVAALSFPSVRHSSSGWSSLRVTAIGSWNPPESAAYSSRSSARKAGANETRAHQYQNWYMLQHCVLTHCAFSLHLLVMSLKRKKRVLAIDDEPAMTEWLKILLEHAGYEVRTAL